MTQTIERPSIAPDARAIAKWVMSCNVEQAVFHDCRYRYLSDRLAPSGLWCRDPATGHWVLNADGQAARDYLRLNNTTQKALGVGDKLRGKTVAMFGTGGQPLYRDTFIGWRKIDTDGAVWFRGIPLWFHREFLDDFLQITGAIHYERIL